MTLASPPILLSLIIFLPALGALVISLLPKGHDNLFKQVALVTTLIVAALTVYVAIPAAPGSGSGFEMGKAQMQYAFSIPWIESFNIYYALGLDGISLPLVLLTSFLSVLAMGASWTISKHVKAYCVLFLLLEMGMLGVFLALDFFLFYVFWEVMLLPMYFLIGVWGGPRREYAAIKFFLFTMAGSVLMLVALLALYFNSDLNQLGKHQLAESHIHSSVIERHDPRGEALPLHTFNLLAFAQLGQLHMTHRSTKTLILWGQSVSMVGLPVVVDRFHRKSCRRCRCIRGCPTRTSRRRRRSR